MTDNHMKRLESPKTWKIEKKKSTFVTKPTPAGHEEPLGTSLNTFLKEMVDVVDTTKEVEYLLKEDTIEVNKQQIYDHGRQVGFLDIISLPEHDTHYMITIGQYGELQPKEVSDDPEILSRIEGKTYLKGGRLQLNTQSGRNVVVEEDNYSVGDSIKVDVSTNEVVDHFPREKGSHAFIFTGKHAGKQGTIDELKEETVKIQSEDETFETRRAYLLIIGEDKPEVDLEVNYD